MGFNSGFKGLKNVASSSTIPIQDKQTYQNMYKCSEKRVTSYDNNQRLVLQYLQPWTQALMFGFTADNEYYDVIIIFPARRHEKNRHTKTKRCGWQSL